MTDSYGKPANLTPALLWPSTAIRFQTRDKRKNRAPTTFPSKSTCWSLFGRKNCLYLAGVLLKPKSSRHSGLEVSSIIWDSHSMHMSTTSVKAEARDIWTKAYYRDQTTLLSYGRRHFLVSFPIPLKTTLWSWKQRHLERHLPGQGGHHCSSPTKESVKSHRESQHCDWSINL